MVKRLRHRPFTAVTGVQIPLESLKLNMATWPSGKAKVCNTSIAGSNPARASKEALENTPGLFVVIHKLSTKCV